MKILKLTIIVLFLASCNEIETANDLLERIRKIEPILTNKCNSKAVVTGSGFNGKIVNATVLFLTKNYEINTNISCSNTVIKDEFMHFFQNEYGYTDVIIYIKHDNGITKL